MCFLINTQSRFASSVFKRSTSTWRFPCFSVVLKSKGKICWKTFDKGYSWGLELEAVKSTLSNKSCSNKKFLADLLLSDIEPLTLRPLCSSRLRSNKKCSVDQLLLGSNLLKNVRQGQTFLNWRPLLNRQTRIRRYSIHVTQQWKFWSLKPFLSFHHQYCDKNLLPTNVLWPILCMQSKFWPYCSTQQQCKKSLPFILTKPSLQPIDQLILDSTMYFTRFM